MKNYFIICVAALVMTVGGRASAADQNATTPPSPPYLRKPPVMSCWTIRYDAASGEGGDKKEIPPSVAAPEKDSRRIIQEVKVLRTGKVRLVEAFYTNGEHDELWADGSCFVERDAKTPPILIKIVLAPISLLDGYQLSDFPDFTWVSQSNYLDTVTIKDRRYLRFSMKRSKSSPASTDTMSKMKPSQTNGDEETVIAWIDEATRLPAQWACGKDVHKVAFSEPPTAPIALPADIAAIAAQMHRLQEITSARPPIGG